MADQRIIVPEKKIITNASLADRAVAFISALKHTKGEWHGKNFELLPWQEKVVRDVFGTVKEMSQDLADAGFTIVPFGQGFKDMSPPTKELMKLVLEGRIAHGGNAPLRWMMDNIYVRTDPAGNIKPDKEKSTERIDGAVATIMALDRAIRHQSKTDGHRLHARGDVRRARRGVD